MASQTPFLRAILPSLPSEFAKKVRALCASTSESTAEHILDTLIRFISGAECAPNATADVQHSWTEKQQAAATILNGMVKGRSMSETKRPREDDEIGSDEQAANSQRSLGEIPVSLSTSHELPPDPLFAIHSVSATSPVRKKVDITIHKTSLVITHPSTHAVEANISLATLSRAFLLPTRGKQKAHWTIVLLTSDTSEPRKLQNSTTSNTQVIFGIDAIASVSSTIYESETPIRNAGQKGAATRPTLLEFLNRLGIPFIEPTPNVFKSACVGITSGVSANEDGVPGIEAYRGAKIGSLWFTEEGILWGESKPCEFWALKDLIGKSEGVRVIGGSGRTCTVVLTRKSVSDNEDVGDDEEDMGVETEFGMVDSKEKPGIEGWLRRFRGFFGKTNEKLKVKVKGDESGKKTIMQIEDETDEEDGDFEMDTDESDGSGATSSESSDDDEGGDGGSDEEDDESEDGGGDDQDEEELTEERHPLLRPGAMPRRMNRAVIDMVVGIVEDEMLGTSNTEELGSDGEDGEGEEEELEEDELDD